MKQNDLVFDTNEYLERINYKGEPAVSLEFLKGLHRAHLHTVPFENFDICLNRGVDLEPSALYEKIVRKRRGGYCFEVNGLFLMALEAFGFVARALLGRVHTTASPTGRGHQLSLVTLEGQQWLVDVGFGEDTPPVPISLRFDQSIVCRNGKTYRLTERELFGVMLQIQQSGDWKDLYSFDMGHVCAGDILYGNHFTSTHPRSLFVSSRVAVLPTKDGVMTLFNMSLKTKNGGVVKQEQLEEGGAYIDALRDNFGIDLEACYEELKPIA